MENSIIFIHGAGGRGALWTRQKGLFKGSLAPDLPGHPMGEGREWIGDYASWVNEYRLKNRLEKVYLVGHSMGGAIALMYALFFPYSLKGLVLMGTGATLSVSPSILNGLEEDYKGTVERVMEYSFAHETDQRMKDKSKEEMMKIAPEVLGGDFLACQRFHIEERLGEIETKTLIIVGEEDRMTPVRLSKALSSTLPDAQLEIIPSGGHMLMLEKYRRVNQLMNTFFLEKDS